MKPRFLVHAFPAVSDSAGTLPPQVCVALIVPTAGDANPVTELYSLTPDEAKALLIGLNLALIELELEGLPKPAAAVAAPKADA